MYIVSVQLYIEAYSCNGALYYSKNRKAKYYLKNTIAKSHIAKLLCIQHIQISFIIISSNTRCSFFIKKKIISIFEEKIQWKTAAKLYIY